MLEGRGLSCMRGSRTVFQDLEFTLRAGQLMVVRGSNGAGKSSLLRLISGLLLPQKGNFYWKGQQILPQQGWPFFYTYIGHETALKKTLTVYEDLGFWHKVSPYPSAHSLKEALAYFNLLTYQNILVGCLSAGQKRRLSLCRLLVNASLLWVLDEPTSFLDSMAHERLMIKLNQHLERGGYIILATHEKMPLFKEAVILNLDKAAPSCSKF